MLQSVEWKSKSVNCTIGAFSDIIYAIVLGDIFSQVSLSFTPLSDTISFHCSLKAIVTGALRVGPVFFRPIIERGKKNNVSWDYFRSTLFKNGSIIFLPFTLGPSEMNVWQLTQKVQIYAKKP